MKIGIIYTAYNTEEYVEMSLKPWIEARDKNLCGHQYFICALNVPFEGFIHDNIDNTLYKIKELNPNDLLTDNYPIKETTVRGAALNLLMAKYNVDYLIQWDSDEKCSLETIQKITEFIDINNYITWFKLSYKNLVFTENQYLEEPFIPARIHKTKISNLIVAGFWDDNNIYYTDGQNNIQDIYLSSFIIPKNYLWIPHYTWLNNIRSKKKIEYQTIGRKWPSCSFRWDEKEGLKFNEDHFKKNGQPIPKILNEN